MNESQKRACLAQLDDLIGQTASLMNLVGSRQVLFGPEKQQARDMLKALKTRLRDEYHRTSTVRGQQKLNPIERNYYAHAVHEAYCELQIKTRSVPGSSWTTDLYAARMDLEFPADQLRDQLARDESAS